MRHWFARGLFGLTVLYALWLSQAPASSPEPAVEPARRVSAEVRPGPPEAFLPLLRAWQGQIQVPRRLLGLLELPRPGAEELEIREHGA
jgi:hypothetical protein